MNLALIDRWCALSAAARCTCWSAALLVALFAGQAPYSAAPVVASGPGPGWRQLLALRDRLSPVALQDTVPFSPLNVQTAGAQLVSWQPDARGGELRIESDWASIPALFPLLASSDAAVTAFSIVPQAEKLGISLQLEITDER